MLANPIFLRAAITLVLILFAFVVGVIVMKLLKQSVSPEAALKELQPDNKGIEAYHGVITRLKQQEKELAALRAAERQRAQVTENLSAAVLNNLASGVVLLDPRGLVRQANPAARRILGYASPSNLHARDLFRGVNAVRLKDDDADQPGLVLAEAVDAALRQGQAFRRIEADYRTPAGEDRVLGITLSPVKSAAGEPMGVACLVSDLTELTQLSRQVRLRERQAALGEMSAGIAHEFKNSLATISGYAQMLQSQPVSAEFAGKIVSETANLTRIVTDFLNFARPLEMRLEPVELRPLLADCAAESGIAVSTDAVPAELRFTGDRVALRQAFSNLMRNSAEAGATCIEVQAEAGDKECRLTFRDNGPGIPADVLPRIFIPFFTTKGQGTGLGLALVHRIVTGHGGAVQVASDPSGTAFTLPFPAAKQAKVAANPE